MNSKRKANNMYNIRINNYQNNKKNSSICTPEPLSQYLHGILSAHIQPKVIFDPSIGQGSLTKPWDDGTVKIIGSDIDPSSKNYCDIFIEGKFEDITTWDYELPNLILCNPPFNGAPKRKLYPEIFLRHMVDLFGNRVPIVLFTPMGLRLNSKKVSPRWNWLKDNMEITSIISLPLDCFEGVKFHAEILIFNVPELKAHYSACG